MASTFLMTELAVFRRIEIFEKLINTSVSTYWNGIGFLIFWLLFVYSFSFWTDYSCWGKLHIVVFLWKYLTNNYIAVSKCCRMVIGVLLRQKCLILPLPCRCWKFISNIFLKNDLLKTALQQTSIIHQVHVEDVKVVHEDGRQERMKSHNFPLTRGERKPTIKNIMVQHRMTS